MFGKPSKTMNIHGQYFHGVTKSSSVLALSTCEEMGEDRGCLAAFFILAERGVYSPILPESLEGGFFDLQIVTFLKRMESNGRVEGETSDLSENIDRDFSREGS